MAKHGVHSSMSMNVCETRMGEGRRKESLSRNSEGGFDWLDAYVVKLVDMSAAANQHKHRLD
jgi:hypothetical protein